MKVLAIFYKVELDHFCGADIYFLLVSKFMIFIQSSCFFVCSNGLINYCIN